MWPEPSPRATFAERRAALDRLLPGPKVLLSGLPRPRNFRNNPYPFRAESHFLYLIGESLVGAALLVDGDRTALYVEEPPPGDALWHGPRPSSRELGEELGLPVHRLSDLAAGEGVATLPPQDEESAVLLSELLDRDVTPASGDEVEGRDAALADAMIALRLRHDAAAVTQLRYAARVAELAHAAGRAAVRPGRREAEIRAEMEREIVAAGCGLPYTPIVTIRGEVLHAVGHSGKLRPGDLLLADVGAETPEGFASDVTRTWPVAGRFTSVQRDVYEVVLAASDAALAAVRPGARFLEVHREAGRALLRGLIDLGLFRGDVEDLLQRGAAALFFPHGVGHLLGLDVHDLEDLGDRAGYAPGRPRLGGPGDRHLRLDRDLEPGMCVTIEPGFYRIPAVLEDPEALGDLEGALDRRCLRSLESVRGIRIEDDVLVTNDGSEVLTRAIPRAVADVERAG
ncbi:MAG: aminopeptidase P family protein [Deltaproteobacteria bacterium]|nr:aminopeptidase P family protein [Deltaproteobacteria bacterium]